MCHNVLLRQLGDQAFPYILQPRDDEHTLGHVFKRRIDECEVTYATAVSIDSIWHPTRGQSLPLDKHRHMYVNRSMVVYVYTASSDVYFHSLWGP